MHVIIQFVMKYMGGKKMNEVSTKNNGKRKLLKMPSTPALLLIVILLISLLTYIIPAGQYERQYDEATERTLVVPNTYHRTEQSPIGIPDIFSSVYEGIIKASDIISFVFVVGGAFSIVSKSGALESGIGNMIKKFKGREYLLIIIMMVLFSVGGATFGMAEEVLPFVTVMAAATIAMGYDSLVGVAIILLGIYSGYSAGPLNPFSTGIAQGISELPLFSGIGLRIVLLVGSLIIAIQHILSYCKKIKNNNNIINEDVSMEISDQELQAKAFMSSTQKIILVILVLTIGILVFGVLKYGWFFKEISALFFAMSVIIGLILYKGNFEKFADEFLDGAAEMTSAALLIGLSRAVLVVAEQGEIMDTIVYAMSIPLSKMSNVFAAWGMYFLVGILNFLIPSSSGQAVVVMPIMSALSDVIGITRQVSVLAFQCGDGFWNLITPTHAVTMATIGLAGVSFNKWFKFMFPLIVKWTILIMVVLAYGVITNWGPF